MEVCPHRPDDLNDVCLCVPVGSKPKNQLVVFEPIFYRPSRIGNRKDRFITGGGCWGNRYGGGSVDEDTLEFRGLR